MNLWGEAPALRFLKAAGENVRRLDYAFVPRGGTRDAALQLGLSEHEIVKSLVFDDGQGGHAVMALMHGDRRVSLHKLQRLSGEPHLQPSSPEDGTTDRVQAGRHLSIRVALAPPRIRSGFPP